PALAGTLFGPPIQVTPPPGKGYEPAAYVDQFGNIYATAHKENWQLVLGPDPNSPTYTRSMSWDWVSTDGGLTFHDLPGLTAASEEHTSELQSPYDLVCRLLLEKKKQKKEHYN